MTPAMLLRGGERGIPRSPLMLLLLFLVLPALPARAHDWYPYSCCAGRDCHPVDKSEVKFTPKGWHVLRTGETISFEDTRPSPDGQFHRCSRHGKPDNATTCLFAPDMGS